MSQWHKQQTWHKTDKITHYPSFVSFACQQFSTYKCCHEAIDSHFVIYYNYFQDVFRKIFSDTSDKKHTNNNRIKRDKWPQTYVDM